MWAPKTQQILLISNPYINESKQRAKLLFGNSLDPSCLPSAGQSAGQKRKAPTGKPRPKRQPCKISVTVPAPESPAIETESLKRSGGAKNDETGHKYGDTSSTVEKIISVAETSSKVYEPKTYKEAITDPIQFKQWRDAIEEEIQNLENHQTWEYDRLPTD